MSGIPVAAHIKTQQQIAHRKGGGIVSRLSSYFSARTAGYFISVFLLGCAAVPLPLTPVKDTGISNLHAALEDETENYRRESVQQLRWRTQWVLRWEPTPLAVGYVLAYKTAEGVSKKPTELDGPVFRIEVAKGDNPNSSGLVSRELQLLTIQSFLSVRVAARFQDGSVGIPSPWIMVGSRYNAVP